MGVGLVEPVDDLRASNVSSNARLLDALAAELVKHHFDTRYLLREICRSRSYQLASVVPPGGQEDKRFYSRYYPKSLSAEQLLDALADVTELPVKFPGFPLGTRAHQLPDTRIAAPFLDTFGRPLRRSASCECERLHEPNLGRALELLHGKLLNERIQSDQGLVGRLIAAGASDDRIREEIFLRCFSRRPTVEEVTRLKREQARYAGKASSPARARREFSEELLWAAFNTREFLFNH
jgi:hypothetical protein